MSVSRQHFGNDGRCSTQAIMGESAGTENSCPYGVYGISVRSRIPLSLPTEEQPSPLEVELRIGPSSLFSKMLQDVSLRPIRQPGSRMPICRTDQIICDGTGGPLPSSQQFSVAVLFVG